MNMYILRGHMFHIKTGLVYFLITHTYGNTYSVFKFIVFKYHKLSKKIFNLKGSKVLRYVLLFI